MVLGGNKPAFRPGLHGGRGLSKHPRHWPKSAEFVLDAIKLGVHVLACTRFRYIIQGKNVPIKGTEEQALIRYTLKHEPAKEIPQ